MPYSTHICILHTAAIRNCSNVILYFCGVMLFRCGCCVCMRVYMSRYVLLNSGTGRVAICRMNYINEVRGRERCDWMLIMMVLGGVIGASIDIRWYCYYIYKKVPVFVWSCKAAMILLLLMRLTCTETNSKCAPRDEYY
jgi:hypothetical protein